MIFEAHVNNFSSRRKIMCAKVFEFSSSIYHVHFAMRIPHQSHFQIHNITWWIKFLENLLGFFALVYKIFKTDTVSKQANRNRNRNDCRGDKIKCAYALFAILYFIWILFKCCVCVCHALTQNSYANTCFICFQCLVIWYGARFPFSSRRPGNLNSDAVFYASK